MNCFTFVGTMLAYSVLVVLLASSVTTSGAIAFVTITGIVGGVALGVVLLRDP